VLYTSLWRRHSQRRMCKSLTVAQAKKEYDYDLLIIGCGVGGHGAALHAVECVSPRERQSCLTAPLSLSSRAHLVEVFEGSRVWIHLVKKNASDLPLPCFHALLVL
jgi:hypothetical protein